MQSIAPAMPRIGAVDFQQVGKESIERRRIVLSRTW